MRTETLGGGDAEGRRGCMQRRGGACARGVRAPALRWRGALRAVACGAAGSHLALPVKFLGDLAPESLGLLDGLFIHRFVLHVTRRRAGCAGAGWAPASTWPEAYRERALAHTRMRAQCACPMQGYGRDAVRMWRFRLCCGQRTVEQGESGNPWRRSRASTHRLAIFDVRLLLELLRRQKLRWDVAGLHSGVFA